MTNRTWVGGGNNRASNAGDWSPDGAPQPGDALDMQSGVMNIRGNDLAGDTLVIGAVQATTAATLNLSRYADVSLQPASLSDDQITVNVRGSDTLHVQRSDFPSLARLTVNLADHASLAGEFKMLFGSVSIDGGAGSRLINDGSILLQGAAGRFDTKVQGNGSFTVKTAQSAGGRLEFSGFVSRGQSVSVEGDPGRSLISHLQVDQPSEFKGAVALGGYGEVDLQGLFNADSYEVKQDMLSIYSGCTVIEKLRLTSLENPNLPNYSTTVFQTSEGVSIARVSLDGSYHGSGTLLPTHT